MIALMCRLFAFRSVLPLCAHDALCGAGNSLTAQSRRDARGESHADGWGLATVDHDGEPHISKSVQPAYADPQFDELAKSVATTLVAHVRQASVGRKALENSHPFVHGRWIFAHNGTLEEFSARKRPLLDAIPDDLRQTIRGDTDSEHVFLFWLSQLRTAAGGLDKSLGVDTVTATLQQTIKLLDHWFRFPEVKQNWLGFSRHGNHGNGLGADFAGALRWRPAEDCAGLASDQDFADMVASVVDPIE
jgi:glutamine amidotransferase